MYYICDVEVQVELFNSSSQVSLKNYWGRFIGNLLSVSISPHLSHVNVESSVKINMHGDW